MNQASINTLFSGLLDAEQHWLLTLNLAIMLRFLLSSFSDNHKSANLVNFLSPHHQFLCWVLLGWIKHPLPRFLVVAT